jgi:hypothetical protein
MVIQAGLGKNEKYLKKKRAGDVAQVGLESKP